ncbi:hypothetical protein Ais01nite_56970 [Asanoa ishikariensis]|uniref:Uncharacterized conserved protein, DUF58 family, contains vWF domain n=1 Tax=Asanoa ishikariensis TaxID=137265 RepID=A0A1H3TXI8_9ACTN|nr:DUF58 domain-containing protein [Asanoa ishikariensis]GIF67662.1 hypothetical protein Ais01nite_56970 [Asanoa ishikariensis]SDZ54954.1 Uncharacterized conserved protein, DUF58 family, contains vWF domain [Asanoa ishikariensis]
MRPTARGVGLAVAGVALVGVGWRFGYAELAALGGAALVAIAFAVVHAAWRPRLSVSRQVEPDRVGRGEPAGVTLTVRNSARLRAANLLAHDRCGPATVPVPVLRLRPGRDTTVDYPVPTTRRGVVTVGPLRVSRRDPLGLVTAARSHGGTGTVWVHPRIHPLTAVPAGAMRSLDGRVDSVPHGTITFDSLREYVVGDELRRVHWRTSARIGELMVREQLDTSLPQLVVLLDNRAAAHPDRTGGEAPTFEAACEAAASVVTAAVRADVDVTLLLVAGDTTPATRPLDRLAEAALTTGDLQAATDRLRQQRAGDTVIFLTGTGARGDLGLVGALRGPYAAIVAAVFGAGTTPAAVEGMVVLDAADGEAFAAAWDGVRGW